jgi:hypothetical protein
MPVSVNHRLLPEWYQFHIEMDGKQLDDMAALRKALSSRGVNSRGWRLYIANGDALFWPLREIMLDSSVCTNQGVFAATWLKILQACEMDVLPPVSLVASISRWGIPEQKIEHLPVLFLRAVWKACIAAEYAGAYVVEYVDSAVVPVAHWYFSTGQYTEPNVNLLKAGWESIECRYKESTAIKQSQLQTSSMEWSFPLGGVEYSGLRFVPLGSVIALAEEGRAMRHCIGSYGDRCRKSSLRAFSIRNRKTGNREATVTVIHNDGYWQIDAISGKENAKVDDRIVRATDGLLRSLDEATAEDAAFNALISNLKSRHSFSDIDEFDDECCLTF